ncbi:MAG: VRR-NUC domain-containing protein [Bacteroidota bacterium]|nr:VRR-NUC domain-containing protein [Bacteroidota bacterium]
MTEKEIEKYLIRRVKSLGGISYKFTSPGNAGVPDRIVVLKGKLFFVELKTPGKEVRALQRMQIDKLLKHDQIVYVADSKEKIDLILKQEGK